MYNVDTAEVLALASDPRVHESGGWLDLVVGECPTPTPSMHAAVDRAIGRSREHIQAREDSFQRCDTDGFLTQWADGLNSSLERLRAEVLSHGGFALFPALYSRHTGERVNAVLREGKYGYYWMLRDQDKPTGTFIPDTRTKRAKMYKSGFVVLGEWAPAKAYMAGEGYGLSGRAWAAVKRVSFDERDGADLAAKDAERCIDRYLAGDPEAVVLVDALLAEGRIHPDPPTEWSAEDLQTITECMMIVDAFAA